MGVVCERLDPGSWGVMELSNRLNFVGEPTLLNRKGNNKCRPQFEFYDFVLSGNYFFPSFLVLVELLFFL